MAFYKEHDVIQLCIERLATIYGQSVRLINSRSVGGGCINHSVKVNTSVGDFFLKWNAECPPDLFLKEAAGLEEMQSVDNPYLMIPKVIWSREADELPGLLLLEYLQPAATISGFDERLGRGIARLHSKTASNYGFHHSNYCGTTIQDNTWTNSWPEFYAQRRIWNLVQQINSSRGLSSGELKVYERLVEKMPQLLFHPTIPSLIHGDLWSGNYMYTSNGPALIDPACYYADREMELGMMQLFGGFSPAVWKAYQEEYPLPEGWQKRIPLYQLYHILNHHLLFGGSYGRQALEIAKAFV
ncbi:MAG: fructosamine kinase family protein [Prolixibacteraceae bacterium]|nr:fructosamine kinase family protein [Prolixibacteraceae bacterium]